MHPVLVIAGKDLRQRLRDRSAIVLGFVAPVLIAWVMSLAFGSAFDFHARVAYVGLDRGALATAFHDMLTSRAVSAVLTLRPYSSESAARAAVEARDVDAAIVVPVGFTAAVHGGGAADVRVLGGVDQALAAQVCRSLSESFVSQVNADRLSVATAVAAGASPARLAELTAASAALRLPVEVRQAALATGSLETLSYYAPGMGIFFVLFAISFGARSWFLEKAAGTLDRIAAAPMGIGSVLVGKALSTFVYAVASLSTMAVFSSLVFHAHWGNPWGVAVLIVATALSVVALTSLVIALARTERQADGLASILIFGLALAGGNFVFLSVAPAMLRRLSLFTPNGWALRGFTDLASGVDATTAVLVPVAGILAFTAVLAGVTFVLTRRLVRR